MMTQTQQPHPQQSHQQDAKAYGMGKWDGKIMGQPDMAMIWNPDYCQGYFDGLAESPEPSNDEF